MTALWLKLYAKFDGVTWTDITSDVLQGVVCTSGIMGNSEQDRVAGVGALTFELNNSAANSAGLLGYYSPSHANKRTGFKTGLPVKAVFQYEGVSDTTKWKGEVVPNGIAVVPGALRSRRVGVTCNDWMMHANQHRVYLMQYVSNKTADELLDLVLANMARQPDNTLFDTGDYTFVSGFDTVREYTTAMSEFQKIALSERGYIYLIHNRTYDECLVFENSTHRDDTTAVTEVSAPPSECGSLLLEDGSKLLLEDGGSLLLEDTIPISLDNEMCEMEHAHGNNFTNYVIYTVYPKEEFSGVLCTTQSRISLKAGETKTNIRLSYTDPDAKASKVACKSTSSVTSTMNSKLDGTGTNLTANLTLAYTAGSESLVITSMTNGGATDGYVYLTASGTGIRIYEAVSKITEDTDSINTYGVFPLEIRATYQNDPVVADEVCAIIRDCGKEPYDEIKRVTFYANTDIKKQLFLDTQLGARVHLVETVTGISEDYFIQGWEWAVIGHNDNGGDLIKFSWYCRRAMLDLYQFIKWDTVGTWDDEFSRWYV